MSSGRACYTIGTKFLWTAGGWFDYLNLRTNGFDFHMALTQGEVPRTDERVRAAFAKWRELIDMGAFIANHQTYSWQEALPFIVSGEATAYLMGNFSVAPMREAGLTDDKLDFYQFVEITPGIAKAEDAPTDTFHIPANAKNKEAAREFLRYVVSAENQTIINNGQNLGWLGAGPLNVLGDPFLVTCGIIAAGLWPQTAYCMILYLTGLNAVDPEQVEAARLDGARGWRMLWHVIIPQLKPATFIAFVVTIIGALRSFDLISIMTNGGPFGSSRVLSFYMFEKALSEYGFRMGYGASIAVVLFLIMLVFIAYFLWSMHQEERGR